MPKVVHLSTFDSGGAANAAIRLNQGLRALDIESDFMCLIQHKSDLANHHLFPSNPVWKRALGDLLNRVGVPYNQHKFQQHLLAKYPNNYEYFSFAQSDFKPENHSLLKNADIIHLHWVAGFINYPSFFRSIKKPIVWTLHDMNPFSGGFHYENDTKSAEGSLKEMSIEEYRKKKEGLGVLSKNQLHVVTPSQWLKSCSEKSDILGKFSHTCIPYGLDTDVFRLMDKEQAKRELNLSVSKPTLLFVSQEVDNYRKGFHLLKEALGLFTEEEQAVFEVLVVGEGDLRLEATNIFSIGKVNGVAEMARAFNAADAFIMPSLEDNLPNVMLESVACGTPVIAFPIGGVPDVIENGGNGVLANELSAKGLYKAIKDFLDGEMIFERTKISQKAHERFSLARQAKSYLDIYNSKLAK